MILQTIPGEQASRETLQAFNGATALGVPVRWSKIPGDANECHVGSVEFCEAALGFSPRPDYYPSWLNRWLYRGWWIHDGRPLKRTVFGKPANGYKSRVAKIYNAGEDVPADSIVTPVLLTFAAEWRYYVADGKVVATGWYDGLDDDEPAPTIAIDWPEGFCGAVDFGRLVDGRIALVECQHPYGCGNYLENSEAVVYAQWIIKGWEWTLKQGAG